VVAFHPTLCSHTAGCAGMLWIWLYAVRHHELHRKMARLAHSSTTRTHFPCSHRWGWVRVEHAQLGWILPLHETSETYLAGVVFMVGANFILLGSTKVVAILSIYHDLALGVPTRALAGLLGIGDPKRCDEVAYRRAFL
jgi:hypothetical protein